MFPEETASNEHFQAPLEVLVPAKRGTASFRNVLHPLKIRGPKSVTVLDCRCETGRVHVLQEQLVPRHSPVPRSLLDHSPPHEPVFSANQLSGALDETALPDVATCLLLLFLPMTMMPGQCHHTRGGCRQHPVLYRGAKATRSRAWRRRILGVPSRRGRVVPAPTSRHHLATHALATPAIGALLY